METQIKAAEQENRQANWGDIAGLGYTAASLAQSGFFNRPGGGATSTGLTSAQQRRMSNMPAMTPTVGFRGTLNAPSPLAVSRMNAMGVPQPTVGFTGALPDSYNPTGVNNMMQNIPQYLNPMTSPYQPTPPSQWWYR